MTIEPNTIYDTKEAANLLGISIPGLIIKIKSGKIPAKVLRQHVKKNGVKVTTFGVTGEEILNIINAIQDYVPEPQKPKPEKQEKRKYESKIEKYTAEQLCERWKKLGEQMPKETTVMDSLNLFFGLLGEFHPKGIRIVSE